MAVPINPSACLAIEDVFAEEAASRSAHRTQRQKAVDLVNDIFLQAQTLPGGVDLADIKLTLVPEKYDRTTDTLRPAHVLAFARLRGFVVGQSN